jgi:8-oxo-dGTP pyrophosphatase MutT (NUDIX family)
MHTLYFNDKPVFFVSLNDEYDLKAGTPDEISAALHSYQLSGNKSLRLASENPDATFQLLNNIYTPMFAAGGIVLNRRGDVLMIFRNGKWDLPKGKIETGEEPDGAALREVEEECSIKKLTIIRACIPTFHTYVFNHKEILKKTFWYLMETEDDSIPVPQLNEGIEKAQWLNQALRKEAATNTYASIADLLHSESLV